MTNLVTGAIGVAGLLAFLGILLWWIKAPPLIVICLVVIGFVLYDFWESLRANGSGAG